MNIIVSYLPSKTTEKKLEATFALFGKITSISVISSHSLQNTNTYAFLHIAERTNALYAIEAMNGKRFEVRQLSVQKFPEFSSGQILSRPSLDYALFSWAMLVISIVLHNILKIDPNEFNTTNLLINVFINTPLIGVPAAIGTIKGILNILEFDEGGESKTISILAILLSIFAFIILIREFPHYIWGTPSF